jgi:hypothetical protein
MQNQKRITTLVGIIIIVIVSAILFGGVFAYQYFSKSQNPISNFQLNSNSKNTNVKTINEISDILIVNSIDKLEQIQLVKNAQGKYYAKYPKMGGEYTIGKIVKGDLNGDGLQDAFVWSGVCGGSCGSVFAVVLNNGRAYNFSNLDGFVSGGASQYSVKDINITNGLISMKVEIPERGDLTPTTTTILNYKLEGSKLIKIN